MKKFNLLKKNRVNNSGQGLAELAVFGSLLLMVFGFLVRYGMQYNYQQEVKMEAFRRALKIAYDSDVAKSHEVMLVKDVHIPNPQDMFAQGDRQTIRGAASVTWNNGADSDGTNEVDYTSPELSPSIKYIFNPDKKFNTTGSTYTETSGKPTDAEVIVKEYTTAALTGPVDANSIVGTNLVLKGVTSAQMVGSAGETKVYQQETGANKEVMILMSNGQDCENEYCPKSILEKAELGFQQPYQTGLRYFPVHSVNGDAGEIPDTIVFLDSEGGDINATLQNQQTDNKINEKHNRLVLSEDPTVRNSTDILDETESVAHVIITQDTRESPTFVFTNDMPKLWTTPK